MKSEAEKDCRYPIYRESIRIDTQVGFRYNYHQKKDNILHLHRHDYYELFFLPDKECMHYANQVNTLLPKGTLLFIRPNDCHDFVNSHNENIPILQVAVSKAIIESLFEYLGDAFPSDRLLSCDQPPYVVLTPYDADEVLKQFGNLHLIPYDNHRAKTLVIRAFLVFVFANYFAKQRLSSSALYQIPDWLSFAYNEMKKQENFSLGINQMVSLAGCSKEYLCRSMKKYYHRTAMDYINDLRLTYIANMLIYTSEDISDLCYRSGFNNNSWMYTLFKKKYGMSPIKFRKEHADNTLQDDFLI